MNNARLSGGEMMVGSDIANAAQNITNDQLSGLRNEIQTLLNAGVLELKIYQRDRFSDSLFFIEIKIIQRESV